MATLQIEDGQLVVRIHGMGKLLALRSSLTIPLEHVKAVEVRPADARGEGNVKAYRVAGTYMGSTLAGYFWASEGLGGSPGPVLASLEHARESVQAWPNDARAPALEHVRQAEQIVREAAERAGYQANDRGRGWVFFEVHEPDKAIGIDLEHETLRRIVVQVDDETPDAAAERIRAALRR